MTNDRTGGGHLPAIHEAAVYRIRVAGLFGHKWADRVEGMQVVVQDWGGHRTVTELTGTVADQAALQGLLDLLYARGCVLPRRRADPRRATRPAGPAPGRRVSTTKQL